MDPGISGRFSIGSANTVWGRAEVYCAYLRNSNTSSKKNYPDRFVRSLRAAEAGKKQEAVQRKVDSKGMTTLAPAKNSRSKRKDVKDGEYSRERIAEDEFQICKQQHHRLANGFFVPLFG